MGWSGALGYFVAKFCHGLRTRLLAESQFVCRKFESNMNQRW
jgi:hypothetical protein